MIYSIKIDPKDNVAVVTDEVKAGDTVFYKNPDESKTEIKAITPVTVYHKIAVCDISKGDKVVKYGEHIGEASCDIKTGEHVHTHNVESVREDLKI